MFTTTALRVLSTFKTRLVHKILKSGNVVYRDRGGYQYTVFNRNEVF